MLPPTGSRPYNVAIVRVVEGRAGPRFAPEAADPHERSRAAL
jgi:hypothetical protein